MRSAHEAVTRALFCFFFFILFQFLFDDLLALLALLAVRLTDVSYLAVPIGRHLYGLLASFSSLKRV